MAPVPRLSSGSSISLEALSCSWPVGLQLSSLLPRPQPHQRASRNGGCRAGLLTQPTCQLCSLPSACPKSPHTQEALSPKLKAPFGPLPYQSPPKHPRRQVPRPGSNKGPVWSPWASPVPADQRSPVCLVSSPPSTEALGLGAGCLAQPNHFRERSREGSARLVSPGGKARRELSNK